MIQQELKNKAIELRRSGKSYNEISKITGIANGMLSYWFRNMEWSRGIQIRNKEKNVKDSKERIMIINKNRSLLLSEKYAQAANDAVSSYALYKNDTLFVSALMLYLGEGDKSVSTSKIRMGNIDYYVMKIFIKFLYKYCNTRTEEIKFWLLSYPDLDSEICLKYWLEKLNLCPDNAYKTQIIQGKHKAKRLRYGVGNIILSNKVLKIKILKWIELSSIDLS